MKTQTNNPYKEDLVTCQKLAHPLIYRNGKAESEICLEYSNFFADFSSEPEKKEKRLWDLIGELYSKHPKINSRYEKLARQNPELNKPIVFLQWLEDEYHMNNELPKEPENIPFYYARTGRYTDYFSYLEKNHWEQKAAYCAGALDYLPFAQWRQSAMILEPETSTDKEFYHILCGDRSFLQQRVKTGFDTIWLELTVLLTQALAREPYNIQTVVNSLSDPSDSYQSQVLHVFKDTLQELPNDELLSLRFRVHASAIFGTINKTIVQEFCAPLIEKRFIGLVFFYCSLLEEDDSIKVISRVLIGLPAPDKSAIATMERFSIHPNKVIEKAIDQVIEAEREDFDDYLAEDEFITKKINIIDWLQVANMENLAERKVRKLLGYFTLKKDFVSCDVLMKTHGKVLKDEVEANSWQALIKAELEPNEENLYGVLQFKGTWMKGCEVEEKVMRFVIPLIVEQLFDIYAKQGNILQSMIVFAVAANPSRDFDRYFPKEEVKKLLLKAKEMMIKNQEIKEKREHQQNP